MDDEPSELALRLSGALTDPAVASLSPSAEELSQLTRYERRVLEKTARKHGWVADWHPDALAPTLRRL